jgi:dolichol-phosphate mannosyltransferase
VKEIPMAAHYDGEPSSLSIPRVIRQFPRKLIGSFLRRIVLKNFIYDFNLESLHLALGAPLLIIGLVYGVYNWIWYSSHAIGAPTGTVVLPAVLVLLGVQLLLSAMNLDLLAVPREPVNGGSMDARGAVSNPAAARDANPGIVR